MKNLGRALRMTLKYRWSIAFSLVCSVLVAILWSANLGAVYPFVEVILQDKSLHQWLETQDAESQQIIADSMARVAEIESQLGAGSDAGGSLPASQNSDLKKELVRVQYDIETQQTRQTIRSHLAPWIKAYAPQDQFTTLLYLMGLMFFGTVMRGLFLMGSMVSVARIGQRTKLDLQNQVFENVLDMEASELGVKGTGDLVGRIRGETNSISQAIMTLYGKTVREPLKMFTCIAGAAVVNWRLLLFSLLICPLAGFLMVYLAKITKRANKRAMEESARLLNRLYQALTYLRVVKAFTSEDQERERFRVVADDVYHRSMRIAVFGALSRINNELLGVSMITLSVLAGGYLVLNSTVYMFGIRMSAAPMSFGELMVFFGFLIGVADPLRKMADVYNLIQGGAVAADRVFPLVDQQPLVRDPANPQPIPAGALGIEFDNVWFEYETGKPVLRGLTASVPAGSSLAIVGHNGCGKSTLINLIPRFFDVGQCDSQPSGIFIGGKDVRQYRVRDLRQKIGYVTQQTMLFSDSVADNIAYGSPNASREDVVEAARQAHAHEFIKDLEAGYEANIGEHGGKLSGGQRQRLSLARAILKDPEILILDEATSQIDPESEMLIHQTLAEFIQGRTTVVITHRMSTLELVDRILLMKNGEVVDCGTHEQLLARCPEYQKLRNLEIAEAA